MGCLMAPLRLLFLLLLVTAAVGAWLYRDELLRRVRGGVQAPASIAEAGRPADRALRSSRAKVASLGSSRADSVVLTPSETASLLRDGLRPEVRSQLDSIEVRLGDDEVEVRALLSTARLPKELVGPLAIALRDREHVTAAGPLQVVGAGRGEWAVRRFAIRDFPLPRDAVPRVISKALGDSSRQAIPVQLPRAVRAVRVQPSGVILYGAARP
jgi:hypothetical protein